MSDSISMVKCQDISDFSSTCSQTSSVGCATWLDFDIKSVNNKSFYDTDDIWYLHSYLQ